MYHELTYRELARRRRTRIICALLVVLVCIGACAAFAVSRSVTKEQGAASLRESIVEAAVQCCAVEGSYPSSIGHLEEDYGLVVNNRDYIIQYEWLGDNVPPSVVVRLR